MIKIEIINPCLELKRLGVKHGDLIEAEKGSELTGSMYFEANRRTAVVWPENYKIAETTKNTEK